MYKIGLLGCGKLGSIIAKGLTEGRVPGCKLEAIYSIPMDQAKAKALEFGCRACESLEELLAMDLDYVIEATGPAPLREYLPKVVEAGKNIICLSTGVFAEQDYCDRIEAVALEKGCKVYMVSGCVGGIDLANTFGVMGDARATVINFRPAVLPPGAPAFAAEIPDGFEGPALEGFAFSPSHLNVVIAGARATGQPENARFKVATEEGQQGFGYDIQGETISASIRICNHGPKGSTNSAELAAWSALGKLKRLTSTITF